jgi:hypothetical protein
MAAPVVNTIDYSQTVGTTAVTIFTNAALKTAFPNGMSYMKLFNASATATIYYTRNGNPPVANAAGTYSLAPGAFETYNNFNANIPQNTLIAVATATGGAFTVEVG